MIHILHPTFLKSHVVTTHTQQHPTSTIVHITHNISSRESERWKSQCKHREERLIITRAYTPFILGPKSISISLATIAKRTQQTTTLLIKHISRCTFITLNSVEGYTEIEDVWSAHYHQSHIHHQSASNWSIFSIAFFSCMIKYFSLTFSLFPLALAHSWGAVQKCFVQQQPTPPVHDHFHVSECEMFDNCITALLLFRESASAAKLETNLYNFGERAKAHKNSIKPDKTHRTAVLCAIV